MPFNDEVPELLIELCLTGYNSDRIRAILQYRDKTVFERPHVVNYVRLYLETRSVPDDDIASFLSLWFSADVLARAEELKRK